MEPATMELSNLGKLKDSGSCQSSCRYPNELQLSDLVLSESAHTVTRGGKPIALTPKEFSVLEYLLRNQGIVLSRDKILEHAWDFSYEGASNMVDVYIKTLRKKIDHDFEPKLLHTVRGAGYVLKE